MKREYLFYGLGYLVFVMLFMTPLGVALKREINEKRTAKVLTEQKLAEAEREKLALAAVSAMMQEYPQRSETMAEEEIVKGVRGETITVPMTPRANKDFYFGWSVTEEECQTGPEPAVIKLESELDGPWEYLGTLEDWNPVFTLVDTTIPVQCDPEPMPDPVDDTIWHDIFIPNWPPPNTVTLTIPADAPQGRYTVQRVIAEKTYPVYIDDTLYYEFEVTCMKVTITAAPSGGSGSGSGSGG